MKLEPVIGLEVHVQLSTKSKVFCRCPVTFGAPPNSQTCPVCLGLPGALPVLNRQAVAYALRLILAVEGHVNESSSFVRKNYFYPDLPKGYQISQHERPLGTGGRVKLVAGQRESDVELLRVHLEEDAGKSLHDRDGSRIDLNRCGVPLVEVVSRPVLHSPEEASSFLQVLRQLVRYLAIGDGNMEEGSMRCDANVSVRSLSTSELPTYTEVKNMNSLRSVERALRFEIDRQTQLLLGGQRVVHQTLWWDESSGRARTLRGKEESDDYRYFPEPDLVPLQVSYEWLEVVHRQLPELPESRCRRFTEQYHLPAYDARVLTADRSLADYFEAAAGQADPMQVAHWLMGEVLHLLRELRLDITGFPVPPEHLAALVLAIERGSVSGSAAKAVLAHMAQQGGAPDEVIAELGLAQVTDREALARMVDAVITQQAEQVAAYRTGKSRVLGYLVGQVMHASGGKADPRATQELLRLRLEED